MRLGIAVKRKANQDQSRGSPDELLVQQALEQAWNDSLPGDPVQRHEEGGWIYMDNTTGIVMVRRPPVRKRSLGFEFADRAGCRRGRDVPHPSEPRR